MRKPGTVYLKETGPGGLTAVEGYEYDHIQTQPGCVICTKREDGQVAEKEIYPWHRVHKVDREIPEGLNDER